MNIAITQREFDIRGWKYDCLQQDWHHFLKDHDIHSVPNTGTPNFADMDCLILSGGNNSTNRENVERMAVEMFLLAEKPIIGICHGAFALNKFFGGVNGTIKGHQDTDHDVMLEGLMRRVNSHHKSSISRLAHCFEAMALDPDGNVEAFQHKSLAVYGMVWHPERMNTPVMISKVEELLRV